MAHYRTARAPWRGGAPERAWHGARWRARDLARMARFEWEQMGKWEAAGALILACELFFLALFLLAPMPASAHLFCTEWSALLCAGGAVAWAVARIRRVWHGRGAPGREL